MMAGMDENPYEPPQSQSEHSSNGFDRFLARFLRAAGWLAHNWVIVPLALIGIAAALSAITLSLKR
jgi:hypothetical protein